jgi:hypothetical protein
VLTVNGTHAFNSLQAISGGLVTHAGGDTNNGMYLTDSQNVYVDPAIAIDASGMGFGTSGGPGGGTNSRTAGGYDGYGGGYGSAAGGVTYGSMSAPTDLGSGGSGGYMSAGGNGGGAVRLTVGGTLQVDGMLAASGVESPGDYKMGGGGSPRGGPGGGRGAPPRRGWRRSRARCWRRRAHSDLCRYLQLFRGGFRAWWGWRPEWRCGNGFHQTERASCGQPGR